MSNINKIYVEDKATLNKLYKDWSFTLEGLAESAIPDLIGWINHYTKFIGEDIYIIKGEIMNNLYNLTGDNQYPEDLNIICIMLKDIENPNAIAIPRFELGGRWFNDVVDNNLRREGREIEEEGDEEDDEY